MTGPRDLAPTPRTSQPQKIAGNRRSHLRKVSYSVEKHPIYALTLRPLWEAVARGDLEVLSSELTLMETLIGPLKQGDAALETD